MGKSRKVTIGNATLYHGDCFEIMPELAGLNLDAVITDPPYGCTKNTWDIKIDLNMFWNQLVTVSKVNAAYCIFSRMPFTVDLVSSNRKYFRYELIFKKFHGSRFFDANKMPLPIHENIEIFYKKLPKYNPQKTKSIKPFSIRKLNNKKMNSSNWNRGLNRIDWYDNGLRYPVSIIEPIFENDFFKKASYARHPTQKPVSINTWLIKTYTDMNQTVFDPFMGNGSAGVSAIIHGRKFIGIEKEQKYFEIACARIKKANDERSLLNIANEAPALSFELSRQSLIA